MSSPVILSFGGGVNSAAVLTRWLREGRRLDLVVFADTGEEDPRTMGVVAHAKELCARHGVELHTVRAFDGERMVDWYRRQGAIPFIRNRSCTDQFKLRPIRRHLTALGLRPCVMLIGIARDEAHRVRNSDRAWITNEFPLCDWGMDRAACEAELQAHWTGPPVPKSGCEGCPQGGKRLYARLLREKPVVFARWQELEEAGRNYPTTTLLPNGPSLAELRTVVARQDKAAREQRTLFDDDERGAFCGGGCFT